VEWLELLHVVKVPEEVSVRTKLALDRMLGVI